MITPESDNREALHGVAKVLARASAGNVTSAMNEPEVPPLSPNIHPVPSNGRRHTGPIEAVLHRCWPPDASPPTQLVTAVDRLATLPSHLAGRLASEMTGIYIGLGMVTDYPAFADLYDQPVDPSRPDGARWQHIPAGYRNRVIVIGSGGTPLTRDLTMHDYVDGPLVSQKSL